MGGGDREKTETDRRTERPRPAGAILIAHITFNDKNICLN